MLTEEKYAKAIDQYMMAETLPNECEDDLVCSYIKLTLSDKKTRTRWRTDSMSRVIIKNSLMEFVRMLMNLLSKEEKGQQVMLDAVDNVVEGRQGSDIEKIEQMKGISDEMSLPFRLDGYCRMIKDGKANSREVVKVAAKDAKDAICEYFKMRARQLAEMLSYQIFHNDGEDSTGSGMSGIGLADEETIDYWRSVAGRYPEIFEIAKIMGRQTDSDDEVEQVPVNHYMPQLVSPSCKYTEIDGATIGNDIRKALPTEIALLSDADTQWLFYQKFTTDKMLLYSTCPPEDEVKSSQTTDAKPRPRLGPIIVGVDTSGSMHGEPEKIARAMVLQLLELAIEQQRKCYLVLWAVLAKAFELTSSENFGKLLTFLQSGFTGGTDPEDFLKLTFNALDSDDFAMADVLMISDFLVPNPNNSIINRVKAHQQEGTRFYGLRIGNYFDVCRNPYTELLDRIWNRNISDKNYGL